MGTRIEGYGKVWVVKNKGVLCFEKNVFWGCDGIVREINGWDRRDCVGCCWNGIECDGYFRIVCKNEIIVW